MIENLIGKRYSEALSGTITEEAKLNPALDSLKAVSGAFEIEPNLVRFFAHPTIAQEKKGQMVKDLCKKLKVSAAVQNMLLLLTRRKKILFLKNIVTYFEQAVDMRMNQVRVDVCSAHPLSKKNVDQLKSSLSRVLGKTVLLDTEVDESLIGGIQLRVGDQVADATIKNRLATLKRILEKEEVA